MTDKRGLSLTQEPVGEWCTKFGGPYRSRIRSRSLRFGKRAYLDEVLLKIQNPLPHLWRAVRHASEMLNIDLQRRPDKRAAKRSLREFLNGIRPAPDQCG